MKSYKISTLRQENYKGRREANILYKGFTSLELFLSLIIVGSVLAGIVHFASDQLALLKGQAVAENSVEYAKQSTVFLKTYYMALEDALTDDKDASNGKIITIPMQVLKDDGFIAKNYPEKNKLNQYPCITVTYADHQLEAYLYFRDDGDSKALTKKQQDAGREHAGGMLGFYEDREVKGGGNTWSLSSEQTTNLFIKNGSTEPAIGIDPGKFKCPGSEIANKSFVINYASILELKNRLPKDDTLSQYPDPKALPGDISNGNTMNSDLNMDGDDKDDEYKSKHAVIFQMNPDCVMNPESPATMQDYDPDPKFDGTKPENYYKPNTLGCKNRQLSIRANNDGGKLKMVVTGFQQGGDQVAYENYKSKYGTMPNKPFVGELKAQSFQASNPVAVGTACEEIDIGTMAKQQLSGIDNDVNSLYVSQVICMKNPLCPASTKGICFMPSNSITITYQIPVVKNDSLDPNPNPNAISAVQCPAGMAMVNWKDDHENSPRGPDGDCCLDSMFGCQGHKHVNNDGYLNGPNFYYLSSADPNVNPFKNGVQLGYVRKAIWCDTVCFCGISGGYDIRIWQPQVTSITCSNDMNRVPVQVYK